MASFRSSYPTPLERQFGRFYRSHQYAHLHKNNSVCLIGLAPDHPAVAEGVVSVEYSSSACSSEALGKRKRGALRLCVDTIVCTLITQLGTRHIIRAGINGDLVEINSRLSDEPNLVSIDPEGAGFICVALTRGEADLSKCFPGYTSSGTIGEAR